MLSYLPEGISTYAADIDHVMWVIYVVVGAWFVLAEVVLFALILRGRARDGERAVWLPGGTWRTNAVVLVPVALVFLCDILIEQVSDPVWHHVKIEVPNGEVTVRVTGRQFLWLFTYGGPDGTLGTSDDIVANEMHVPMDKVVHFELESSDVLHSFFVPALRLKQDAIPGRSVQGWFQATKEGTYEIGCAEICGKGHTEMRSTLVVQSPEAFNAWLAGPH